MLALRRLTTTAFGTLMSLEPALALLIGLVVLGQAPGLLPVAGIAFVVVAGIGAARTGARPGPKARDRVAAMPLPLSECAVDSPTGRLMCSARAAAAWRVSTKLPVRDCQRVPHPHIGGYRRMVRRGSPRAPDPPIPHRPGSHDPPRGPRRGIGRRIAAGRSAATNR